MAEGEAPWTLLLLQGALGKLTSGVVEELGSSYGIDDDLEHLKRTFSAIQDVLGDAEARSAKEEALGFWLRKLRDAAYEADDMLDELRTKALRRRAEGRRSHMTRKVRDFLSLSNPMAFGFKMAHKIKEVTERFDAVAAEMAQFHLGNGVGSSDRRIEMGDWEGDEGVDEPGVYGRDEDKEELMDSLIGDEHDGGVSIIPIVGVGGIGKTTLAQLAYDDERAKGHFDLRIWVSMFGDFDVRRITAAVVGSATGNICRLSETESMHHRVRELLTGRRYLLVLDDVQNEDEEKWEEMKHSLTGASHGSRIIVTTRSERAALAMGTVTPRHLQGLSDEDSWSLFNSRAFGIGTGEPKSCLVICGKEIARKCGGVPLAVKVVGSLMRFKSEESEWLEIRDSEIWEMAQGVEDEIPPALRLGYTYLPSQLKPCFAYCSLFPKECILVRDRLVDLWIAEGFISLSSGSIQMMKDIGNEYFKNLWLRSFFIEVQRQDNIIVTCRMHDLVCSLARSVAGNEFAVVEAKKMTCIPQGCRYSSVAADNSVTTISDTLLCETRKLRTFLLLTLKNPITEVPLNLFFSLRWLRTLDLSTSGIRGVPNSINKLKLLRLLDLSYTQIEALPESIGSLQNLWALKLIGCYELQTLPQSTANLLNLETLELRWCKKLSGLPKRVSVMSNLKHLDITGCYSLARMPSGFGQLHNLQVLPRFIVGKDEGCSISQLKHLSLNGNLQITNLENVRSPPTDAKEANLKEKCNLQSLSLQWGNNAGSDQNVEEVLEGLQPHLNLKKLEISFYWGVKLPRWMTLIGSSLPYLVEIRVYDIWRCKFLPVLGLLSFLKVLDVVRMDGVRYVGREFYGETGTFPALEHLTFQEMPNLKEWSAPPVLDGAEIFPRLSKLTLSGCPGLKALPSCLPNVKELELSYNNEMLLRSAGSLRSLGSSLRKLSILFCDELVASSSYEGLRDLTALEELTIESCEELDCLPESMQHLISVQRLAIKDCPNLSSLGERVLQCFTSLCKLEIEGCGSLMVLPEGLQYLTALRHLRIECCPRLERGYTEETAEGWDKIVHEEIEEEEDSASSFTRRLNELRWRIRAEELSSPPSPSLSAEP